MALQPVATCSGVCRATVATASAAGVACLSGVRSGGVVPAWLGAAVTEWVWAFCRSSPNMGSRSLNRPLEGVAHREKGVTTGASTDFISEEYDGSTVIIGDLTADEITETDAQVLPDAAVVSTVSEVSTTVAGVEVTGRLTCDLSEKAPWTLHWCR